MPCAASCCLSCAHVAIYGFRSEQRQAIDMHAASAAVGCLCWRLSSFLLLLACVGCTAIPTIRMLPARIPHLPMPCLKTPQCHASHLAMPCLKTSHLPFAMPCRGRALPCNAWLAIGCLGVAPSASPCARALVSLFCVAPPSRIGSWPWPALPWEARLPLSLARACGPAPDAVAVCASVSLKNWFHDACV